MTLSPEIEKLISLQSPREKRLMAAKAVLPLAPKDLIAVLARLMQDTDQEVKDTARKSLEGLPTHILLTVLDGDMEPLVIKAVAEVHEKNEAVLVMVVLNRNTDDETLSLLASQAPENVANIIAENQTRLMRIPGLLDQLKMNPAVGKSVIDRVETFLISVGKITPKEERAPAPAELEMPQIKEEEGAVVDKENAAIDEEMKVEKEEISPVEKESLYKRVQHMMVSEKIKMALLGNKEAREILLKDANKLISSTVLKNPRITEDEIVKVVNSRSIGDDILRQVSHNKEWLKKYSVKLGMLNNPKTPLSIALRLLNQVNEKDVQHLAKSKNVSSALAAAAKRIMIQKGKG